MSKTIIFVLHAVMLPFLAWSQSPSTTDYWKIADPYTIRWNLLEEDRLPHSENIEMAGRKMAAILYYDIDTARQLTINRDVIFPQLRTYNKTNEPEWKKYRAYFRREAGDDLLPVIAADEKIIVPAAVDSAEISGMLKFYHKPVNGIKITRTFYPSMSERFLVEKWTVKNRNAEKKSLVISNVHKTVGEQGYKGEYTFTAFSDAPERTDLEKGEEIIFYVVFGATMGAEKIENFAYKKAFTERKTYLKGLQEKLVLKTPDPVINTLFYFSKIRATESIFDSSLGLIHSPGGGNYYVGIWANDQVEYNGPFFPYLGYEPGNQAAYNCYAHFQKNIPTDDHHIPYAFEVDGNFPMTHLDRGDAAMIAYGTAHYVLAAGNKTIAKKLWPLIEWSLKWCHEHRNASGAVTSESDEMEGRIETGTANLSTSALYYGGLKYAAKLAKVLHHDKMAGTYLARQKEMGQVIENYFGANLSGLNTYRYFEANKLLRHWICLPLTMGIYERQEGTLKALFDELWTENGILVEQQLAPNPDATFWDRATLYALRGALKAGATELGFDKMKNFSRKRLLGNHVPYVIEAYPENNMKHLSAESALYCRIFTEGLLGIEPTGLQSFTLAPYLPADWDEVSLDNLALGGQQTDIRVTRQGTQLMVEITQQGQQLLKRSIEPGTKIALSLKK